MKRNLDLPLRDLEGQPYKDDTTLKTIIFTAVAASLEEDRSLSAKEKMQLYGFAQIAHKGGIAEFSAEDLALIKARVAKVFPVLVIGATFKLLEEELPVEKKE